MRYEIITDKEDLLVLIVNNRVVAISCDIVTILRLIEEDYTHHINKTRRVTKEVIIYPELDEYTDKEEELPKRPSIFPKLGGLSL